MSLITPPLSTATAETADLLTVLHEIRMLVGQIAGVAPRSALLPLPLVRAGSDRAVHRDAQIDETVRFASSAATALLAARRSGNVAPAAKRLAQEIDQALDRIAARASA